MLERLRGTSTTGIGAPSNGCAPGSRARTCEQQLALMGWRWAHAVAARAKCTRRRMLAGAPRCLGCAACHGGGRAAASRPSLAPSDARSAPRRWPRGWTCPSWAPLVRARRLARSLRRASTSPARVSGLVEGARAGCERARALRARPGNCDRKLKNGCAAFAAVLLLLLLSLSHSEIWSIPFVFSMISDAFVMTVITESSTVQ